MLFSHILVVIMQLARLLTNESLLARRSWSRALSKMALPSMTRPSQTTRMRPWKSLSSSLKYSFCMLHLGSAAGARHYSALSAVASSASPASPVVEYFRKDYRQPPYSVRKIDLNFHLDEAETLVTATNTVFPTGKLGDDLVLDGEEVNLVDVYVDGRKLSSNDYKIEGDKLTIFGAVLQAVDSHKGFELKTVVKISPEKNLALSGLYKSGSSDLLCTQCEAMGYRRITYSLDRPDVLSVYRVRLEADRAKYPILLSNGNLVDQGVVEGTNKHWAVWEDPFPKPSYLFALVAGDLGFIRDTYTTKSGRTVQLGIYSDKENVDKLDHAMYSLKESMKWDEETFNLECDLDVYNVVATNDFNMGAMYGGLLLLLLLVRPLAIT